MRRVALVTTAVAAALALAGCNSSGTSTTTNAPAGERPPNVTGQAFAKLRSCLKQHGVTLGGGALQGSGQPPTADPKMRKAMRACNQYLPSQGQGGFPP